MIPSFLRQSPYLLPAIIIAGTVLLTALVAAVARLGRNPYPYVAARALLTPAERTFYLALRQAVGGECVIFAKVRLADIIQADRTAAGKNYWQAFTRISSKHADFVLCDPRTLGVLGVVELDDSSHRQRHRQERDEFFNAAFAAAAIPVWRVPVQRSYPPGPLRTQVAAFLAGKREPA